MFNILDLIAQFNSTAAAKPATAASTVSSGSTPAPAPKPSYPTTLDEYEKWDDKDELKEAEKEAEGEGSFLQKIKAMTALKQKEAESEYDAKVKEWMSKSTSQKLEHLDAQKREKADDPLAPKFPKPEMPPKGAPLEEFEKYHRDYKAWETMSPLEEPELKRKKAEAAEEARATGSRRGMLDDILDRTPETGNQELTWQRYNNLSAETRAAVDINTALVAAVEKDKANAKTYKPTRDQLLEYRDMTYDVLGDDVFSTDRDSKTFAPETVKLLDQLGWKSEDIDLDDILNLKFAMTMDDLNVMDKLDKGKEVGPVNQTTELINELVGGYGLEPIPGTENNMTTLQSNRLGMMQDLAEKSAELEIKLGKENPTMTNVPVTAALARNEGLRSVGGLPNKPDTRVGYGEYSQKFIESGGDDADNLNDIFRSGYEALARLGGKVAAPKMYQDMLRLLNPEDAKAFEQYVDERSSQAANYGSDLGDLEGVQYRTPEEFRKLLGLDRKG